MNSYSDVAVQYCVPRTIKFALFAWTKHQPSCQQTVSYTFYVITWGHDMSITCHLVFRPIWAKVHFQLKQNTCAKKSFPVLLPLIYVRLPAIYLVHFVTVHIFFNWNGQFWPKYFHNGWMKSQVADIGIQCRMTVKFSNY